MNLLDFKSYEILLNFEQDEDNLCFKCCVSSSYLEDEEWYTSLDGVDHMVDERHCVSEKLHDDLNKRTNDYENELCEDAQLMLSMGLPISFGKNNSSKVRHTSQQKFVENIAGDQCQQDVNVQNDSCVFNSEVSSSSLLEDSKNSTNEVEKISVDAQPSGLTFNSDIKAMAEDSTSALHNEAKFSCIDEISDDNRSNKYYDDQSCSNENFERNSQSIENEKVASGCVGSISEQWLQYWSLYGEQLVWNSWYEKYSEYIEPDYVNSKDSLDTNVIPAVSSDSCVEDSNDVSNDWTDIWYEHQRNVFESAYSEFISSFSKVANSAHQDVNGAEVASEQPRKECSDVSNNGASFIINSSDDSGDEEDDPQRDGKKIKSAHEEEVDGYDTVNGTNSALISLDLRSDEASLLKNDKFKDLKLNMKFKSKKIKRRFRKLKNRLKLKKDMETYLNSLEADPCCLSSKNNSMKKGLKKFWNRRYSLFSKFDEGIQMDEESWYSVTPEKLAHHQSLRMKCDVIVDTCCGVGGNAIQFAKHSNHVIAIDIDANKLKFAKRNAEIYGVADKIQFIMGDCMHVLSSLKHVDAVFIDPPWGGMGISNSSVFNIDDTTPKVSEIFASAKRLTDNIVIFLPRNTDSSQLVSLAGPGHSVEIEKNYYNDRILTITAYFGKTVTE